MDAPFERGEVDRASLDATERLRARLAGKPPVPARAAAASRLPWVLAGGLFVFAAGMIANPWFERNVRAGLPFGAAVAPVAPALPDAGELARLRTRLAALERPLAAANPGAPMPAERLARTEARVETSSDEIARANARIDKLTADLASLSTSFSADRARSEAAVAAANLVTERTRGLLTLLLARRAIDAGRPLGALDPVLRQGFEARYPLAVQQVAALGAAPVTVASLRRDFEALRLQVGARPGPGARQGWWDILRSTLADAVSRPNEASMSSPDLAAAALARGDVAAAAAQLRRLTGARPPVLAAWLDAANRLQTGSAALATLENAALLESAAPAAPPAAPAQLNRKRL